MTEKKFIQIAVDNGWTFEGEIPEYDMMVGAWFIPQKGGVQRVKTPDALLNVDAWQHFIAGTGGWDNPKNNDHDMSFNDDSYSRWLKERATVMMHRMIDSIVEGKTIKEFIEEL